MPHREQLEYELRVANKRIEELENIISSLLEEVGMIGDRVEAVKRINNTYKELTND